MKNNEGVFSMAKHIKRIDAGTMLAHGSKQIGCGECQASCQSACKTSCTVGNQSCQSEK
jgi:predicted ribosomally synthesized six-cysteine peptide SCIFF